MVGVDNPAAVGAGAILVTLAIQALKNAPAIPWMTRQTQATNLIVSLVGALIASGVIHYTWDPHEGVMTFVVSTHMIWAFVVQWVTQHGAYKGLVVPAETLGEIRSLLQRQFPPPISVPEAKTQQESK